MSVFVIAEAGSCHDGRLIRALDLVEAARDAGADAVKFQFWSNPDRLADRRRVPDSYREIYRRYQMSPTWLPILQEACEARSEHTRGRRPIEFMCTTYMGPDLAVVEPFVKRFKIASFEADSNMVHGAMTRGRQVIVSTGMLPEDRLRSLVLLRNRYYTSDRLAILHCVSSYPVSDASALNLAVIDRYGLDGLSDHSRDVRTGGLAVAACARIIEAHLRLEDTDPMNPDFATAFTPGEFAEYVRNIRFAESVMGTGVKELQACEREMSAYRVQGA